MVRDQRLWPLDDPGEITDTQLVCLQQGRGDGEPGRVGECASKLRRLRRRLAVHAPLPQSLGYRKVKAKQIAPVIGHTDILTDVGMRLAALTGTGRSVRFARLR